MPMDRVRLNTDVRQTVGARERAERSSHSGGRDSFRDHLSQIGSQQVNERIDKALIEIEELGTRLSQSLSLSDLRRYRQVFSSLFRDLTTHMFQTKSHMEWDAQSWEHRTLVTVRKVNTELEQLAEMVLSQEQDRLGILAKIGEIKGMVVDLRL